LRRAWRRLRLGNLRVRSHGYNAFILGSAGMSRKPIEVNGRF
jgi:hypothetical protein